MKANVSKAYGKRVVFENFALEIEEGEIVCVLGESGAGKTTLLRILAGLTDFEGELEGVPEKVGYVFQEPRLLPHLSVEQNLCYAIGDGAKTAEKIAEMLKKTGLSALKDKRAGVLSGGEKQRVALARAFLSGAPLLLLDEPFCALDTALKLRLWKLFAGLWKETRATAVLVTHDVEEAWALGHRIVVLRGGKVTFDFRPTRGKEEIPAKFGEICEEKRRLFAAVVGADI